MMGTGTASASPSKIKMFVRARSAEELVISQLQTNTLLRGQASYTDIQNVDGIWYAWFLVDVDQHREILEAINGDLSDTMRQGTSEI